MKKLILGLLAATVLGSGVAVAAVTVAQATPPPAVGCLTRTIGNINPGYVNWDARNETHYTGLFRTTLCGEGYVTFESDGWRHIGGCGYVWAEYWTGSRWLTGPSRFVCDGYAEVVLLSGQPRDRQYRIRGFTIQYSVNGPDRWFMGTFRS